MGVSGPQLYASPHPAGCKHLRAAAAVQSGLSGARPVRIAAVPLGKRGGGWRRVWGE